jgi:hypothetical protein
MARDAAILAGKEAGKTVRQMAKETYTEYPYSGAIKCEEQLR